MRPIGNIIKYFNIHHFKACYLLLNLTANRFRGGLGTFWKVLKDKGFSQNVILKELELSHKINKTLGAATLTAFSSFLAQEMVYFVKNRKYSYHFLEGEGSDREG